MTESAVYEASVRLTHVHTITRLIIFAGRVP